MTIPRDFQAYYKKTSYIYRTRPVCPWLINEQELWSIWQPVWHQRTRYRMTRLDFTRPVELGNVRVMERRPSFEYQGWTCRDPSVRHHAPGDPEFHLWAQARRCRIDDQEYSSLTQASKITGIPKTTLRNRCLSRSWPEYEFLDPPRRD